MKDSSPPVTDKKKPLSSNQLSRNAPEEACKIVQSLRSPYRLAMLDDIISGAVAPI
jgi:hypothetical protein